MFSKFILFVGVSLIAYMTVDSINITSTMFPTFSLSNAATMLEDIASATSQGYCSPMAPIRNIFGEIVTDTDLENFQMIKRLPLDIKETDQSYEVSVDIPGVDKDKVKVTIDGRVLKITAERTRTETKETETFRREERYTGINERLITLGDDIDEDHINGEYKDGVLYIHIAKKENIKTLPKSIEIKWRK